MSCVPGTGGPKADAEGLVGSYRLKLVATEGPRAGQATEGTLGLRPYEGSLRAVTIDGMRDTAASYVHYGSADVDLEAVGAVRLGNLGSLDPTRPGAVVLERKGVITLRLGSEANRRDVVRFDGGFTALRVAGASREGFTGSWTSGVGIQRSSAGYFCAVRMEER
ncbi:MAG TPA: hypothetical protein VF252_02965 [Gemmatimonadales bacterium]